MVHVYHRHIVSYVVNRHRASDLDKPKKKGGGGNANEINTYIKLDHYLFTTIEQNGP